MKRPPHSVPDDARPDDSFCRRLRAWTAAPAAASLGDTMYRAGWEAATARVTTVAPQAGRRVTFFSGLVSGAAAACLVMLLGSQLWRSASAPSAPALTTDAPLQAAADESTTLTQPLVVQAAAPATDLADADALPRPTWMQWLDDLRAALPALDGDKPGARQRAYAATLSTASPRDLAALEADWRRNVALAEGGSAAGALGGGTGGQAAVLQLRQHWLADPAQEPHRGL